MAQKVEIEVRLDNRNFSEDANKVKLEISAIAHQTESEGGRMGGVFDNLGKKVAGAFAVSKLIEFEKKIISVRSEMESLQKSFESLAGEQVGRKLYEDIKQFATTTPMMMNDLAKGAQTLLGFNIEAEKIMPILRQIGDISMGDAQKFNSLTLAFAQMSSTGKLMGQDLLQMINAGFNPLVVMAEKSGKSVAQLKDEMSKGLITVEMVEDAFRTATAEGGKFHNMLEAQSKTMRGALSNLQGAYNDMLNEIGGKQQGLMLEGVELAQSFVKNYEKVGQVLLGIITTYGTYRAAIMAVNIAEGVHTGKIVLKTRALRAAAAAQALLNKTMLANPYVLAATALGVLVGSVIAARDGLTDAERAQRDYNKTLEDAKQRQKEYNDETQDAIRLAQDDSTATEDRESAMKTLIARYPEIIQKYIDEKGHLTDILNLKREIAAYDGQMANEDNRINADLYKRYIEVIKKSAGGHTLNETERILYEGAVKKYKDATPWYEPFRQDWDERAIDYFTNLQKQAQHAYGRGKTEARVNNFMETMGDMKTKDLKKLVSSLSKSASRIKKDNQVVKVEELGDFLNSTDLQGLITKANGIINARTKPKKDPPKTEPKKDTEKQAKVEEKMAQIKSRQQVEQERAARDLEFSTREAEIKAMQDGTAKKVRQIELDRDRELDAISRAYEDMRLKRVEEAKMLWDADPKNKDKNFYESVDYKTASAEKRIELHHGDDALLKLQREERELLEQAGKSDIIRQLDSMVNGNVDVVSRPIIDAAELVKKGWEGAGEGIANVFSSIYDGIADGEGKEHSVIITPILPDGTVLTQEELKDYIDNVLSGAEDILKADSKGLVVGIDMTMPADMAERLREGKMNVEELTAALETMKAVIPEDTTITINTHLGEVSLPDIPESATVDVTVNVDDKELDALRENLGEDATVHVKMDADDVPIIDEDGKIEVTVETDTSKLDELKQMIPESAEVTVSTTIGEVSLPDIPESATIRVDLDADNFVKRLQDLQKEMYSPELAGKMRQKYKLATHPELQNAEARNNAAFKNYAKGLDDIEEATRKATYDFLKTWGDYEQQKWAITQEYEEKIRKASSPTEAADLSLQRDEELRKLEADKLMDGIDWGGVFSDLQGHTREYLIGLRDQLQAILNTGNLPVDQMATIQEKISEINGEISKQNGLFQFQGDRAREHKRLLQEEEDARKRLIDLQVEQTENEYKVEEATKKIRDFLSSAGLDSDIDIEDGLLSQFDPNSEQYKRAAEMLKNLRAAEGMLADSRKKTEKAASEAKRAEDKAKRSSAQAVADWFSDAQKFIAEKGIDQIPDLFNSLGLESLGEKAAQGLSAFNNASDAVTDFTSGNYIGAATKALSAIKDVSNMLGIGGDSDKTLQKDIERLTAANEVLTKAVSDLADKMGDATIIDAMKIYKDQIEFTNDSMKNTAEMMQRSADDSSTGWLGLGIGSSRSSVYKINEAMSSAEWQRISRIVGKTVTTAQDFFRLTSKEMYSVFLNASDLYAKIKEYADDGYKDAAQFMDQYIEYWKELEELETAYYEKLTNTSFDSLRDQFKSSVMDMDSDQKTLAENFEKYMKDAIFESMMLENYDEPLKAWWKKFGDYMESGGTIDFDEQNRLRDDWNRLVTEALEERNRLYDTMGWPTDGTTGQQSASVQAMERINVDQANEIVGRLNAGQMIWQQGNNQRDIIIQNIAVMHEVVSGGGRHLGEMVTLIQTANGHLADIVEYNKKMYREFGTQLDEVITQIKKSSYA